MRKLFVSFTGMIRAFIEGEVTEDDLVTGLFYLGCVRNHAINPWQDRTNEVLWYFKDDQERARLVHDQIVVAITRGENEGRVNWRQPQALNSYEELNVLLERNGVGRIELRSREINGPYCYLGVVHRVKEAELQLEVVL
jgi:hypothetical protein